MRQGDPAVPHLAVLGLSADALDADDVVTGGLQVVNVMTAGALIPRKDAGSGFQPLLETGAQSVLFDAARFGPMLDPSSLLDGFQPSNESYAIAARIHGKLPSAFPNGSPVAGAGKAAASLTESQGDANIIVVADTDILSDMLWIRRQSVFGQGFAVAWANNGDLLANALDNLAGSSDLISVRGRQSYFRPFTRVDELRRQADERLRGKEQELDAELRETEQKLTELEGARSDAGSGLVLTPAQQQELERFQTERVRIRKELRDVRRGLDVEIDRLGARLKAVNILLVPALLAVGALVLALVRRRRLRDARLATEAGTSGAGA
jgi:ABC-type uncharacterized transport system involved in gliding motility auxiliary subunit